MQGPSPIRGLIFQCRWLLLAASLIVPKKQRKSWYEQQYAHVWHWAHFLYESGRLNAAGRLELLKYALGGFSQALWTRFDRDRAVKLAHERPRTPRFCLLAIAAILFITLAATGFAPTIRSSFSRLPYRAPERLASLSFNNQFIHYHSDTLFVAAALWTKESKTAEAVSAYSWWPSNVNMDGHSWPVISARVAPDFFEVLGINAGMGRLFHPGDDSECSGCIVISHHFWEHGFHSEPAVIGKQIILQEGPATIVGVLPSRFWFISPEISVWSVAQSAVLSYNSAQRTGAVLRLRPGATLKEASSEFSKFVGQSGSALGFDGIEVASIGDRVRQGTETYLLFIMLAFFGSLVLLAYRLVNSSGPKVNLRVRDNYRWWLFFAAKSLLLLVFCFVFSLEAPRRVFLSPAGAVPSFVGPVCAWLFLVTTVLALTWSLHDQCRRCRLCLKRLEYETYVGAPARLFLDWWGTELVCSQGHGMLHVPEMHASWLEMEHWTPLDDSWKSLFESEDLKVT